MPKKQVAEQENMQVQNEEVAEATNTVEEPEESETEEEISVSPSLESYDDSKKEVEDEKNSKSNIPSYEDILLRNTSNWTGRIETMSKRRKKEMYASEHIIVDDDDELPETESTLKRAEYADLVASAASNKILKGTVTSIHYANDNDPSSTILANITYGHGFFEIVIPSYVFFDYDMEDVKTVADNNQVMSIMKKRIGSPVSFVVRTITNEGKVFADRLLAMSLKSVASYLPLKGKKKPRIMPGQIVQGTIVTVLRARVIVEAFGSDIIIPLHELSWLHIGDANGLYKIGQHVNVRIKSVEPYKVQKFDNAYTLINVEGSVRETTEDPHLTYYDRYRLNGLYSCQITHVGEKIVFATLDGRMDIAVAYPSFGATPVRGETRIVQITKKEDEKKRLYGIFVHN